MDEKLQTFDVGCDTPIINCIRFLAVDAIEKAKSGHPGMPMGAAPMAYVLWDRFLRHNPRNPKWPDRDRFVLSAGHGSMLLYALLHLSGYNVTLDDLREFRQWDSKTPGHPEYGRTPGVEATTGPLGQGLGNAVGMAIAERHLASMFNKPGMNLVDHYTYVMVSDGDMMEGINHEAASLAGHLGLGKLIVLYDDNRTMMEGKTSLAFSEDVISRYAAYGWHTLRITDGNDCDTIASAIETARNVNDKPSLIAVRTFIAYGSPNMQGSPEAHGAPLGSEETAATKAKLRWPAEPDFYIPEEAKDFTKRTIARGTILQKEWDEIYREYGVEYPDEAGAFEDALERRLPPDWNEDLPMFDEPVATREASGMIINAVADRVPQLVGGSSDLATSVMTLIRRSEDFSREDISGRNIRFGVREHAMGAILSGLALHKGVIPYGGTFLVFSDYMRATFRLAAQMKLPVIYLFSHDSIGLGEDGPTYQPVEQLASLRAIPGLTVIRPADAKETLGAWIYALHNKRGPIVIVLTRQVVPLLSMTTEMVVENVSRGAYTAYENASLQPNIIIIATGSEVKPSKAAARMLAEKGVIARVVSMPSWELFMEQSEGYRKEILPDDVKKMSVEALSTFGWERWTGNHEYCLGVNRYGESAPGQTIMKRMGFTAENIAAMAQKIVYSS